MAEQDEHDTSGNHADSDQVALPWRRSHEGLSDERAAAVGHRGGSFFPDIYNHSHYSLLDRLSTNMTTNPIDTPGVRPDPNGPAAQLPWLLRRTNQRYRAVIRDRLAERGFAELPQPGHWALMVLARGSADAQLLIREMGVSKQAVSKLVDALVTGGFVDRRPNGTDRRRTDLSLSARGRIAADLIAEAALDTEDAFSRELGGERFADLVAMLEQLCAAR